MIKLLTNFFLVFILLSCKESDKKKNDIPAKDTASIGSTDKTMDSQLDGDYFSIGEDSITISPFEIEVTLSPKAEAKITKGKETIIIDVLFTGTPRANAQAKLEEDGSFFVASATKEIRYGQVAKFDNIKYSRKIYNQLADKDIDLGVNVYSGRKSSSDNLLVGDGLFEKISKVVNKKFTLHYKLIYGDN